MSKFETLLGQISVINDFWSIIIKTYHN